MKIRLLITMIILLLAVLNIQANDEPLQFSDPAQAQRYSELTAELRCLVCQNQSLADSNAGLAQDLRLEVYRMVIEGTNNEDIVKYLVARYGDFVLYRPPFKSTTWLLWLSPFIFLSIGIGIALTLLRRQKASSLSKEEQEYATQLLQDELSGEPK